MNVPKGKKVYIGNRVYKSGEELPKGYTLTENKKTKTPKKDDVKIDTKTEGKK